MMLGRTIKLPLVVSVLTSCYYDCQEYLFPAIAAYKVENI